MFFFSLNLFRETRRNEASADKERGEEAASIVEEGAEDWSEAEPCSKCGVHQGVNQARVAWETSEERRLYQILGGMGIYIVVGLPCNEKR